MSNKGGKKERRDSTEGYRRDVEEKEKEDEAE